MFVFPVGDKTRYRFTGISAPNALGAYTTKYIYENSDLLYPHSSKQSEIGLIDNAEYWTIHKTAPNGQGDVLVTLSWDENTTTPTPIVTAPESDIHIVRWDSSLALWVDEGGVANSSDKTVTTATHVTGVGPYTLARVKTDDTSCVKVFNAVTPNGDSTEDYFLIDCLDNYADNSIEIFDRWGVQVYATKNYGSVGNVFRGLSNRSANVGGGEALPTGVYFYTLKFKSGELNSKTHKKAGYLYLITE